MLGAKALPPSLEARFERELEAKALPPSLQARFERELEAKALPPSLAARFERELLQGEGFQVECRSRTLCLLCPPLNSEVEEGDVVGHWCGASTLLVGG